VEHAAPARGSPNGLAAAERAAPTSREHDGAEDAESPEAIVEDATARLVAVEEMPAPSPWVAQAWEERAAAVGATATAAAPAGEIVEADGSRRGWLREHAGLVAAAGFGSLALLLVWRRR
jgi:hypothetical protein